MPERAYNIAKGYRYGFNGKETDQESSTQDYGMRIYNPALGRFLSVDPLRSEYPWNSSYAFAENDVIRCIDVEGAEKQVLIYQWFGEKGYVLTFNGPPTSDEQIAAVSKKIVQATGLKSDGTLVLFLTDLKTNPRINPDETFQTSVTVSYDFQYVAKNDNGDLVDSRGKTKYTTEETDAIGANVIKDIIALVKIKQNFGKREDLKNQNQQKTEKDIQIPETAKKTIEYAKKNNGASQPGYRGGRTFENDGREGGQVLPKFDDSGAPITYREYDVNPKVKGQNRGAERVVIGSDNKSYYTNDHYKTFTEVK